MTTRHPEAVRSKALPYAKSVTFHPSYMSERSTFKGVSTNRPRLHLCGFQTLSHLVAKVSKQVTVVTAQGALAEFVPALDFGAVWGMSI
jgi:hypothetical protein